MVAYCCVNGCGKTSKDKKKNPNSAVSFHVFHWNMVKILRKLDTTARCIQFAEESNHTPRAKMCAYHRRPMVLSHSSGTQQLDIFSTATAGTEQRVEQNLV